MKKLNNHLSKSFKGEILISKMERFISLLASTAILVLISLPLFFIYLVIRLITKDEAIYWSKRVGINNKIYLMPKFRTMKSGAPQVATHLLKNPEGYYTKIGKFLRNYSLDELPQIISIIKGDMVFVGPRPALFNQYDLIDMRSERGISILKPGITGWAQVNGRDELSIKEKVELDAEYVLRKSIRFDLYIIWLTLLKVIKKEGVSH